MHSATNATISPSLKNIYNRLHKLHAVNQYDLLSKIIDNDARYEIILEGSDNIEGPWQEYNFLYKPGNVNHSLPYVGKSFISTKLIFIQIYFYNKIKLNASFIYNDYIMHLCNYSLFSTVFAAHRLANLVGNEK